MRVAESAFYNILVAAFFFAALPSAVPYAEVGGALGGFVAAIVLATPASPVRHTELRGSHAVLAANAERVLAEANSPLDNLFVSCETSCASHGLLVAVGMLAEASWN
jgi:hypothetical protein